MEFNNKGKLVIERQEFEFPNLINEGRKYGLNERQIGQLTRYLNDKRLLRMITLESFNRNARAWLSALTGIVAEILAMDARATIWLDKKLERPRNWILSKLNAIIPTKIDDIAMKAITVAQEFMDDKVLPFKEQTMLKASRAMHDRYQYHANATYLGNSLKDLKNIAKTNLKESKAKAKQDALKTLNQRKFQTALIGGYYDKDGDFINKRKYKSSTDKMLKYLKRKESIVNDKEQQEQISQERETSTKGIYP